MKINLKRAHKLVKSINEKIQEIDTSAAKTFSTYFSDKQVLDIVLKSREQREENITLKEKLIELKYDIRYKVQEKNRKKLDKILNQIKILNEKLGLYLSRNNNSWGAASYQKFSEEYIKAFMSNEKTIGTSVYVDLRTEEDLELIQKESQKIKNRIASLEDEIGEINTKELIDLTELDVELLERVGLI